MSTRAQRRVAVTAAVAGGGVGIALAFASALTPPALITSIPTAEPREIDRPIVTESPGAAEMGPLPTLPPPSAGADLSAVMNVLGALLAVAVGFIVILLAVRVARAVAARHAPPEIGDAVRESAAAWTRRAFECAPSGGDDWTSTTPPSGRATRWGCGIATCGCVSARSRCRRRRSSPDAATPSRTPSAPPASTRPGAPGTEVPSPTSAATSRAIG